MSRLLRVELRRLAARRLVRWAVAGTIALALVTVALAWVVGLPTSDAERAQAQRSYESVLEDWERNGDRYVADCEREEERAQETEPGADFGCDDMEPQLDQFLAPVPTFEGDAESWPVPGSTTVAQLAPLLLLLALVVGVSFLTAEISTGAIGLWLTFEPRRQRVYWSKALAAAVGVLPVVAVAYVLMAGGAYGAYALNGRLGPVTADTWAELAGVGGRVLVAAALVAAAGAALGALLRNAAGAVGLVVVWVLVVENVVTMALQESQRWLVRTNLTAWVQGGTTVWTQECTTDATGMMTCQGVEQTVSQAQGGLFLAAVVAVLSALAVLVFRRRDVS
ncbi:ABC transporter permease subunit [Cellulosimicrobium cellulans]|uniref:ABC transporter permease subunit n=1 Tax=Cellulosimicrobium cellulans TaxID=1710 RepID=UPI000848ABC5|nr:ABC transporter permease subunit [Cellulosimicrobium cellulans]